MFAGAGLPVLLVTLSFSVPLFTAVAPTVFHHAAFGSQVNMSAPTSQKNTPLFRWVISLPGIYTSCKALPTWQTTFARPSSELSAVSPASFVFLCIQFASWMLLDPVRLSPAALGLFFGHFFASPLFLPLLTLFLEPVKDSGFGCCSASRCVWVLFHVTSRTETIICSCFLFYSIINFHILKQTAMSRRKIKHSITILHLSPSNRREYYRWLHSKIL